MDIYSGAKSALQSLTGRSELYTPAVGIYYDDTSFFFANRGCGELRAIEEFNEEQAIRKIYQDRSLPGHRPDNSLGTEPCSYTTFSIMKCDQNAGVAGSLA